ncbi:helix-turn-helix transcriptional regulator [Rhizobium sp. P32RR-XVIII]|nr:helix-turn-helix transcriptional regulator [Rhizobium sp. P32RR-XVIII]
MRSDSVPTSEVHKVPQADGYSIITQLRYFERHCLWRGGRVVFDGSHPEGSLAITDLTEDWRCMHGSPFENVRFNIPRSVLQDFAREHGKTSFVTLTCERGLHDPIVTSLAQALVPALVRRVPADTLFIEHMMLALQAHVLSCYGGINVQANRRHGLSNRQLNTATSYLAANTGRDVRVAEVAAHCGLSLSYFIKAFREATGRTPHRWLLEYRAQRSLDMLLGDQSIAEIAAACDFADQAHFSRVFKQIYGATPGGWRHQRKL